ncbi:MAG: DUF4097 family beta strand repeat-containing protein [Gemmatimonadota bacterium]|nr:DUF4097 family beta strand repeat-containing protein [Gemmatimonadota bacterium]
MRYLIAAICVAIAGVLFVMGRADSAHGDAPTDRTWGWSGEVDAGNWVRVRNTNGAVRIEPALGRAVEVTATKKWKGRRPEAVHFAATRSGSDVTICAIWGRDGECDEERYRWAKTSWWTKLVFRRTPVSVDFVVRLPAGSHVGASSVNGGVTIDGATADVVVETVNGAIKANTVAGSLKAETVNGSITVRVDSLPADGDVELETVNGSLVAELPETLDAELDLETVNGRISVSDYPVTVTGKLDPHHLRATLGSGGRKLKMETVNGSVSLKKRVVGGGGSGGHGGGGGHGGSGGGVM